MTRESKPCRRSLLTISYFFESQLVNSYRSSFLLRGCAQRWMVHYLRIWIWISKVVASPDSELGVPKSQSIFTTRR
uniref:Uncharacterized protein n=1 Tax=Arundo donax TaxID=35708 RepID=A0A0A9C7T0_ARUDO